MVFVSAIQVIITIVRKIPVIDVTSLVSLAQEVIIGIVLSVKLTIYS